MIEIRDPYKTNKDEWIDYEMEAVDNAKATAL